MEPTQPKLNEAELDLIRKSFKGNEYLLKALRALWFGLGVSDEEKKLIKSTFNDDAVYEAIKRRLYPVLNKEMEIGMVQDGWLGTEQMIFGANNNAITQAIQYKAKALEMTKYALDMLRDPDMSAPNLEYNPNIAVNDELGVNLLARNQYIRHIEGQLSFIHIIAEQEQTTTQELEKRTKQDSSK